MKKKLIITCALASLFLAGCIEINPVHVHTFSNAWTTNEISHWHDSTCGHNGVVSDFGEHTFGIDGKCTVCGYEKVVPEPAHEHTFSTEWAYNEGCHYHPSTCEHDKLFKDLEPHTFEDGVCIVCGYVDPNYVPSPLPCVDKYFLPSKYEETYNGHLSSKIEFSYGDDLKSYTESRFVYPDYDTGNYDNYFLDQREYSFSDDFSSYTELYTSYTVSGEKRLNYLLEKKEVELYSNSSFIETSYNYDPDSEEFIYDHTRARFFNKYNQEVLSYRICPCEETGNNYFSDLTEHFYDENGNLLMALYSYGTFDSPTTFLESYDEYLYNDDYSKCTMNSYYYSDEGYELFSYTDITREYIDDIRYDTEIYYQADGTQGNTNKFGYNSSMQRVYLNYGGIPEESYIVMNEYGQITKYRSNYEGTLFAIDATYLPDGETILSSIYTLDDGDQTSVQTSTYSHNETNQISAATCVFSGYDDGLLTCEVSYTEYQNDTLLKNIDLEEQIICSFCLYPVVEGI